MQLAHIKDLDVMTYSMAGGEEVMSILMDEFSEKEMGVFPHQSWRVRVVRDQQVSPRNRYSRDKCTYNLDVQGPRVMMEYLVKKLDLPDCVIGEGLIV